jgi:hypothetical protein
VDYYDPTPWIDTFDSLVDFIEARLKVDKVAKSDPRSKGQAYLPQHELELDIVVKESGETLRLTEWRDQVGRFHLGLVSSEEDILRRGDFKETRYHHNPNGKNIPPPHHIHFPTIKYPLNHGHTYAHPVKPTQDQSGQDYISALRLFCDHTKIILRGVSLPLI